MIYIFLKKNKLILCFVLIAFLYGRCTCGIPGFIANKLSKYSIYVNSFGRSHFSTRRPKKWKLKINNFSILATTKLIIICYFYARSLISKETVTHTTSINHIKGRIISVPIFFCAVYIYIMLMTSIRLYSAIVLLVFFVPCYNSKYLQPSHVLKRASTRTQQQEQLLLLNHDFLNFNEDHFRGGSIQSAHVPGPQSNSEQAKVGDEKRASFRFNFIEAGLFRALSTIISDPDILSISSKILSALSWGCVLLSIMGSLGFDTKPLLSIISVTGITLGFAMKDLLSDCFAGVFLLFMRPFQRGDVVTVSGCTGRVESIDMRYVKLFNVEEHTQILIPVASVYKSDIKIHSLP